MVQFWRHSVVQCVLWVSDCWLDTIASSWDFVNYQETPHSYCIPALINTVRGDTPRDTPSPGDYHPSPIGSEVRVSASFHIFSRGNLRGVIQGVTSQMHKYKRRGTPACLSLKNCPQPPMATCNVAIQKQEAQLSERPCNTACHWIYFTKSLNVIRNDTVE